MKHLVLVCFAVFVGCKGSDKTPTSSVGKTPTEMSEDELYIEAIVMSLKDGTIEKKTAVSALEIKGLPTTAVDTIKERKNIEYWSYFTSKDDMSSDSIYAAYIVSNNFADLSYPYKKQRVSLWVINNHGLTIKLQIDKGQFHTDYKNKHLLVKFGESKPEKWSVSESSDGASNVLFFNNEKSFYAKLLKSKTTLIQAVFYQDGITTFDFTTEGLDASKLNK